MQIDTTAARSLKEYKSAFTAGAVRDIHELILEAWPPNLDIGAVLAADAVEVSGLYIGDYDLEYISRGILRHSIYANKILVVDPFVYPRSVRDEFNPILEPEQHRTQTLKNVNFWLSLMPWIEAGIVEFIRTPADFDRQLNWNSLERQRKKFEENSELKAAAEISVKEMKNRHIEKQAYRQLLLSAPDSYIERTIRKLGLEKDGYTAKDFLKYIQAERERDPDFLEPLGPSSGAGQLHMISSGASHDIAQLTASITRSYLVTDLYVKWREIELDRQSQSAESKMWSPFAKALQESPLKYFNQIRLEHALRLRQEGRLESLRSFFLRIWKSARTDEAFDNVNAQLLAEELRDEIAKAKDEWRKIDRDLLKIVGAELGAGLLAAGPLIASGHANFLAAAAVATGATTLAGSLSRHKNFPDRFPAAFFMKIED
ncbi:MAG: hypothetical protein ACREV3_10800 [Gammaproteobacteria bacterium]